MLNYFETLCSPFIVWLSLLTRATKRFDRVGFFFHFWAAAHLQTCQLEITIIVIISNSRKKGGGASKIHLWDLIQFPQLPALLGKFSKILHKNVPFLLLQIRSRYRIFFVYYPCQGRRHLIASTPTPTMSENDDGSWHLGPFRQGATCGLFQLPSGSKSQK